MPIETSNNLYRVIREQIGPLIPSAAPVALFDFPNHSNVGDSAIWLGEIAYLKKYHRSSRIAYVADVRSSLHQPLPKFDENVVILIHGGGNLGDIWPKHQALREKIVANYPRNRVIQLPQSIHFDSKENLNRFQSLLEGHADFHLLARDQNSFEIGREIHKGNVLLCPDMAFCLDGVKAPGNSRRSEIVALLRTDKEVVQNNRDLKHEDGQILIVDWVTEHKTLSEKLERWLTSRYPEKTRFLRLGLFNFISRETVNRGLAMLGGGNVVVTDRLHGHILCTLARIPHVVLDNSYGKIGNYRSTWKTGAGFCRSASNLSEAFGMAHELAAQSHQ
jgi:pyruvyl transferase EpsO